MQAFKLFKFSLIVVHIFLSYSISIPNRPTNELRVKSSSSTVELHQKLKLKIKFEAVMKRIVRSKEVETSIELNARDYKLKSLTQSYSLQDLLSSSSRS